MFQERKAKKQNGFTLVELLLVIVIISILSGVLLVIIQPGKMQGNARDAQRLSDLKVIQGALELYFADHRSYPTSGWIRITGFDTLSGALSPAYISEMKIDPLQVGIQENPCSLGTPTSYRYNYYSDGSTYYLTAIMENTGQDIRSCRDVIPAPTPSPTGAWNSACNHYTSGLCAAVHNP